MNWPGHSAVLHGCTVEDEAFVGMGATLLDGVFVEKHAMVASGSLVRQNTRIPSGEVCLQLKSVPSSCSVSFIGSLYLSVRHLHMLTHQPNLGVICNIHYKFLIMEAHIDKAMV